MTTDLNLTAPVALVLDLLEWVTRRPRTYRATMEAWRTSCPRLPVWEDAVENGFLVVARSDGQAELGVAITAAGRAFLDRRAR